MEELTENAEEPDEEESKQSVQKLGKLQYKVRQLIYRDSENPVIFFKFRGRKSLADCLVQIYDTRINFSDQGDTNSLNEIGHM